EQPLTGGQPLRPARIRADRFTGGVVDGALFEEEPNYRGRARLRLELRQPGPGELGLVLLVLKDLLLGDLPLGGAGSVGRGVVSGRAEVRVPGQEQPYVFDPRTPADGRTLAALNEAVAEFHNANPLPEKS